MKTIHKWPLGDGLSLSNVNGVVLRDVPLGAAFLRVGVQGGLLHLWALVNTGSPAAAVTVHVRGTGKPCEGLDAESYVGTVEDGPFVWHVFAKAAT